MTDYVSGKIIELTPTRTVIDNQGIGYSFEISLQTYSVLDGKEDSTVFVQQQINQRDGTAVDYGFATKSEREVFRLITGVSGIGASTARIILSSLSADELREAILSEDLVRIKSIKGIGVKSAQRLILELKDKIVAGEGECETVILNFNKPKTADEATSALMMLGFSKPNISKAIQSILKENPQASVEEIIKAALRIL